jgi:glucose-6-phosphate dehydrogenase assembly protein OpcA
MEDAMTAAAVSAEQIIKELHQLWRSLAEAETGAHSAAVVRSCSMTLIVASDEAQERTPTGEVLAAIMKEHPSRAIVLRVKTGAERLLEHRVLAQCWRPSGNQQQICSEQIEITASPDMIADVTALLPGLIAPDLPVALWCRTGSLLAMPEFRQLVPVTDKLIIDSGEFPDAKTTLGTIIKEEIDAILGDLTWTRLTRWREAIAQAFEAPANRARIRDLSDLAIGYRTPSAPITALYLAAWVEHVLGREIRKRMYTAPGVTGRTIAEVTLSGPGITIAVLRTSGDSVQVSVNSLDAGAVFPPHSEYQLVGEELSLLEPDPLYDIVLKRAYELA